MPKPTKIEVMKIINVLGEFERLCDKKGVKFGKFSDEELLEILHLYRQWKASPEAPF